MSANRCPASFTRPAVPATDCRKGMRMACPTCGREVTVRGPQRGFWWSPERITLPMHDRPRQ